MILLEAGYLSTQSKQKTTRLIRALADCKNEPEPHHNLVLAAECIRDAGANRLSGDLEGELRDRLQRELERPVLTGRLSALKSLLGQGISTRAAIQRRIAAAEALGQIGGSRFWTLPHGEPEWVHIPAGAFVMGDPDEAHRVELPAYAIARVPITQAQYQIFVTATGHRPPEHWNGRRPPRGSEAHPVVDVTWHDALAYCGWLSEVTGKAISLPSEAEWEKAARGDKDGRMFPWGESFDATRCNAGLQFDRTTPVGIFSNGASPYDCLDLAGNVWEWVRSRSLPYPYSADDGREDLESSVGGSWVLRGGSWGLRRHDVRCAARLGVRAGYRDGFIGFRVVLRSAPVSTL